MANYALDEENRVTAAEDAERQKLYRCLECRATLLKRTGPFRRAHFFHVERNPLCRIDKRNSDHLSHQLFLQEQNAALYREHPFHDLGRIADLVWAEKKIIFEIQCSPISLQEVQARIKDYSLKGFSLFWLLDDRLYNRGGSGLSERLMRQQGYYISLKNRLVYDQLEVIHQGFRFVIGPKMPVDLTTTTEQGFLGDVPSLSTQNILFRNHCLEKKKKFLKKRSARTPFFVKIFFIIFEYLIKAIAKKG